MHHHVTYIYINFQQNRTSRSVKTVHTNLFANNRKLHKFVTCNSNFETKLFSDIHNPNVNIKAEFENNRPSRYHVTEFQIYFHRRRTTQNVCRNLQSESIYNTRCTRGDASSFFLYLQNVFVHVCTKQNFL